MRRFYERAEARAEDGGFSVRLDGRALRTPSGQPLIVPTGALAEALAAEWNAQEERVHRERMPLTRLAGAAAELNEARREALVAEIVGYAETDLVCYRAASPRELVERERGAWEPLLDWLAETHCVRLWATEGVVPIAQDEGALARLSALVAGFDAWGLVALHALARGSGSAVVALACVEGHLEAEAAWRASQVEEDYQTAIWGEDEEAAQRRAARREEVLAAARFLALARAPGGA